MVSLSANCASYITATWTPTSGTYRLFVVRTSPSPANVTYNITGATSFTFQATEGSSYSVSVKTNCGGSFSSSSDTMTTTTPVIPVPTNVAVNNAACHGFTVSWNAVPGAVSYCVKRTRNGISAVSVYNAPTTSVTYTNMAVDGLYDIAVAANMPCTGTTNVAYGQYSASVQANTLPVATPLSLLVYNITNVSATLTTTPYIAGAHFLVSLNGGAYSSPVSFPYILNGLIPYTPYSVSVMFVPNPCNSVVYTANFLTTSGCIPPVIQSFSASCPTHITAVWSSVYGIGSYKVYIHRSSPTPGSWSVTIPDTTYSFNALPGGSYSMYIKSVCGVNAYSAVSSTVYATTPAAATPPSVVTVSNPTCHGFTVDWSSVPGASSYSVKKIRNGVGTISTYAAPQTSVTFDNLGTGGNFIVMVGSNMDCGNGVVSYGSYGSPVPAFTLSCRDEYTTDGGMSADLVVVSPNPSQGNFTVTYNNNQDQQVQYQVSNLLGQVMYASSELEYAGPVARSFSMQDLPNGLYYISILANDTRTTKSVMIAH